MKKFLVALAIVLPFVMTSCTDDEPINLPSSIEINVDGQKDLDTKGTWTSSNEFVATVDKNGKVTAHHVGETVLNVKNGLESASVTVVVNPTNTSYTLPLMSWGADVATVKAGNTSYTLLDEVVDEEGTVLSYLTGENYPGYIYVFTSAEGLTGTAIVVDINDSDNFEDFLYQYYADFDEDEEWYYLLNANTYEDATVAVQYGLNDENSLMAAFVPLTESTRSSDLKSMFENIKFNKSVFKNVK